MLTLSFGDQFFSDEVAACEAFNAYFSSVYCNNSKPDFDVSYDCDVRFSNISINLSDVVEALSKLDSSKGAGPDNIPPKFFRECGPSIATPLHILFSLSLKSGEFPMLWKKAHVVPVHKSGSKHHVENYRPVSILSTPSKLFESIVYNKCFTVYKNIITPYQHGFINKRSTVTNLLCFTNELIDAMSVGFEVHAIYADLSKAFDKINHSILVKKLNAYGICGSLLRWFKSYLCDRCQQVKLGLSLSSFRHVPSGVPQGSILGPFLFSLFINDIGNNFVCAFSLFADDLKIYRVIKGLNDTMFLQSDIVSLLRWCDENLMIINSEKCHIVKFSKKISSSSPVYFMHNNKLKVSTTIKDLGVILDCKLTFAAHIDNVIARANRALGCIKRYGRDFKNLRTLNILYTTYVRSILEYACIVWSPFYKTHIDRIESVQNKYITFIMRSLRYGV